MALGLSCHSGSDGHHRGDHVGMVQAQTVSLARGKDDALEGPSHGFQVFEGIAFPVFLEGQ